MARSDFRETILVFRDALQGAVGSLTAAVVLVDTPYPPARPHGRLFLSMLRAPLSDPRHRCSFGLTMGIRTQPIEATGNRAWELQTSSYSYLVYLDEREILAFHWTPDAIGDRAVRTPHVHSGKDLPHSGMARKDREEISAVAALHVPTGAVPFTAILRMLMRDFGIEPRRLTGESAERARQRTEQALAEAEAALTASFDWWRRQRA